LDQHLPWKWKICQSWVKANLAKGNQNNEDVVKERKNLDSQGDSQWELERSQVKNEIEEDDDVVPLNGKGEVEKENAPPASSAAPFRRFALPIATQNAYFDFRAKMVRYPLISDLPSQKRYPQKSDVVPQQLAPFYFKPASLVGGNEVANRPFLADLSVTENHARVGFSFINEGFFFCA
jgi:hypothetical protein